MCLKEKVMLVNLAISQWSARKYDKKVSKEIEQAHDAHDAGRYNKILINDPLFKAIGKLTGQARTFHYYNTLPWGDNGDRVLPVINYFPYISEMGRIKEETERAFELFLSNYDRLVSEAKCDAKLRLGTMYNDMDYPTLKELHGRFSISWKFMPIADGDDLRVNISTAESDKIKQAITDEVQNRVGEAVDDLIARIKEAVSHMASTLSDPDKIFRDSVVTNICNLADILPRLNFNKDQRIDAMVSTLKTLCCDPDRLRSEPLFRKQMSQIAQTALQTL